MGAMPLDRWIRGGAHNGLTYARDTVLLGGEVSPRKHATGDRKKKRSETEMVRGTESGEKHPG